MSSFFDRFKPGAGDKKKKNNSNSSNNSNPLAGWFQGVVTGGTGGGGGSTFSGHGQSLGGSAPGQVIAVTLSNPGPLGIKIEKSSQGTAIVAMVVPDSQAAVAGLERGDILCFAGSSGNEEIVYDMFLELAASAQRPLCFEVRRVPKTKKLAAGVVKTEDAGGSNKNSNNSSAETYARKQAVIAAAEKREQAHKKLSKPVKKDPLPKILSTADRLKLEQERQQRIADDKAKELSSATRAALEQAKISEQQTVAQLGYNPYEAKNMTSGQARNAVTATTHGSISKSTATTQNASSISSSSGSNNSGNLPTVAAPRPLQAINDDDQHCEPSLEFQQAFETTVTSSSDHDAVVNSVTIMRKLILNATTKGQNFTTTTGGDEDAAAAAKFRKIRLSNPKIQAAITDMAGAVDLLLAVGFQLHSELDGTGENILVYPPACAEPAWLATALRQMEQYVQS